ncbi:MAG: hypothetical protein IE937_09155 [Gammaproteobacteria bacterium]|jgi:peptidoglycan hydrolase CwlO-like protein|nr:hypothetical protein [Gammaproteobacteria bacterium]
MAKPKMVVLGVMVLLFAWVEVAQAASISTRVRILENKVGKYDKQIQAESAARKAYENKVDKKLEEVDSLQKQVESIVKEMNDKKQGGKQDNRYSFP